MKEPAEEQTVRPTDPATHEIEATISRMERLGRPSQSDFERLQQRAFDWSLAGFGRRGHALAQRWLKDYPRSRALRLASATFTLYVAPAAASGALRGMPTDDPYAAALQAMTAVVRGELERALALARHHHWFLDDADHAASVIHLVWALSNLGRRDEAEALLEEWRDRHPDVAPALQSALLRTRAWLQGQRLHFVEAARLLEDAVALAEGDGAQVERDYAEAELAFAYAAAGRSDLSESLRRRWGAIDSPESPIDAYRGLACTSTRVLEGDFCRAWQCADRVVSYAESTGNEAVAMHARFWLALSAPAGAARHALEAYRTSVGRVHSVLQSSRLRVMEIASSGGRAPLRHCPLVERSKHGRRTLPLARLWAPLPESLAADIYYDRAQRRLLLRGHDDSIDNTGPIQSALLDTILAAPGFSVSVENAYEAVWGGSFDPLRHATKVHVALHRLRAFLGPRLQADGVLRVTDARIHFAPQLDVRVVDFARSESQRGADEPSQRLLYLLATCGSMTARDLARELGIANATVRGLLRQLEEQSLVERRGAARHTTYALVAADAPVPA